jgi:rubredoxin
MSDLRPGIYHPDPDVDASVRADALEAELFDLAAGYPARWWVCPTCGRSHNRGHFQGTIGVHRCLNCGYVGDGGTMHTNDPRPRLSE